MIQGLVLAVFIYELNRDSHLIKMCSHGPDLAQAVPKISLHDDSTISTAVRSRTLQRCLDEQAMVVALPFEVDGVVIGGALLTLADHCIGIDKIEPSGDLTNALANLGGLLLNLPRTLPNARGSLARRPIANIATTLTSRQSTILAFINEGLTNREISAKLIVSESTVRQETIKIFRALDCNNRAEAINIAKQLELLAS